MRTFSSLMQRILRIIMTLVAHYVLELYQIYEMFTWHYLTFCHEKKRIYGIPQEEIYLWIEINLETVVSKVH